METFSAWRTLCAGNSPVTGECPFQRPVTRSFDIFFDLRLNRELSKQSRRSWFKTPSCSLWRLHNVSLRCILHMRCESTYLVYRILQTETYSFVLIKCFINHKNSNIAFHHDLFNAYNTSFLSPHIIIWARNLLQPQTSLTLSYSHSCHGARALDLL